MVVEYFETRYKQIFEQVFPHIKRQEVGTLSSVIYLILDTSQAQELCQEYGIKKNASLDDDLDLSDDIIYTISINKQKPVKESPILKTGGEIFKNVSRPFRKSLDDNEDKMELIVLAAVILIGIYSTQKLLRKSHEQNTRPPVPPSQPIPTAICLAVPASAVYDLIVGMRINREKIIQLIESAPEFLCIKVEEANKKIIDTIKQEISPDSQLKFYIRIDIPNGQDIIGAETKYVIKRDIPKETKGEVKDLGRLKDASVLRKFNRI
ncbi:hypothetical protein [Microcystis aeruginosa]|nr:hypothetical protein [Microcystis aeruginosa]